MSGRGDPPRRSWERLQSATAVGCAPLAALLLAAGGPAHAAGGSYLVDDAAVTPEGWCQVESWVRGFDPHATEFSAAPACTRNGVEYGFTATRVAGGGEDGTGFTPGVKWVSGDLWWRRWSVGVAAQATIVDGKVEGAAVYVPATVMLGSTQRVELDANLGVFRHPGGALRSLVGVGLGVVVMPRLNWLAEYLRTGSEAQTWQTGLRWSVADTVSADLVRGREVGGERSWWTLGLNVAFE